jgi:sigma-B regulation protein RsbU (phosphoserine phosphatase)
MTIDVRNSRDDALQNVQVQLQSLVGKHAERGDAYFEAVAQVPRTIAATLSADQTLDEEHFESTLREILQTFPRLIGLGIFFEPEETRYVEWYVYRQCTESEEIFSLDDDERKVRRYVVRDWYKNAKETGQAGWSEPYYDVGGSGLPMCTYSIPLFRGSELDRQFIGVVMIDVGLEDLQDIITKISEEDKRYYLLSAKGQYVIASHPELDLAMKETIFSAAEKFGKEELAGAGYDMLAGKAGILAYSRVKDDRRVYIAYTTLPKTRWHLKVAMDEEKVLEPVYAEVYYTIFYFLVEFTVILVVIVVVAGRLAVPIKRLAAFARKLAAGDLDAHIGDIRFAKEIDQLSHTFDNGVAQRVPGS